MFSLFKGLNDSKTFFQENIAAKMNPAVKADNQDIIFEVFVAEHIFENGPKANEAKNETNDDTNIAF